MSFRDQLIAENGLTSKLTTFTVERKRKRGGLSGTEREADYTQNRACELLLQLTNARTYIN